MTCKSWPFGREIKFCPKESLKRLGFTNFEAIETRSTFDFFRKKLRTRTFSTGTFLGTVTTEPLLTHDSEYVWWRRSHGLHTSFNKKIPKATIFKISLPNESAWSHNGWVHADLLLVISWCHPIYTIPIKHWVNLMFWNLFFGTDL